MLIQLKLLLFFMLIIFLLFVMSDGQVLLAFEVANEDAGECNDEDEDEDADQSTNSQAHRTFAWFIFKIEKELRTLKNNDRTPNYEKVTVTW